MNTCTFDVLDHIQPDLTKRISPGALSYYLDFVEMPHLKAARGAAHRYAAQRHHEHPQGGEQIQKNTARAQPTTIT